MDNDVICHYGVLGMKWGVRRAAARQAREDSRNARKERKYRSYSEDAKYASTLKKKKLNQMTNEELRKLNDRQNLENNYSRLNPNAFRKGLAIAITITTAIGIGTKLYGSIKSLAGIGKSVANQVLDRLNDLPIGKIKS